MGRPPSGARIDYILLPSQWRGAPVRTRVLTYFEAVAKKPYHWPMWAEVAVAYQEAAPIPTRRQLRCDPALMRDPAALPCSGASVRDSRLRLGPSLPPRTAPSLARGCSTVCRRRFPAKRASARAG